jgi:hypothetical protein
MLTVTAVDMSAFASMLVPYSRDKSDLSYRRPLATARRDPGEQR